MSDWDYKADPPEDTFEQYQKPWISTSSSGPLLAPVHKHEV